MRPTTYRDEDERWERKLDRCRARVISAAAEHGPALAGLVDRFLGSYENRRTAVTYTSAIVCYFEWCRSHGVDPLAARRATAREFRASLARLAPKTREGYAGAICAFFWFAVEDEAVADNPFVSHRRAHGAGGKVQNQTPALTIEEFEEVLRPLAARVAAGTASIVDQRDLVLLHVAGRLGIRSISARLFTWGGWRARAERGDATFITKGEQTLTLDVPPDVARILEWWRDTLEFAIGRPLRSTDAVFPRIGSRVELARLEGASLNTMTGEAMWQIASARFRDVGLRAPRLGFHAFRATNATLSSESGASLAEIQADLAHASPTMTQTYIRRRRRGMAADRWRLDLELPGA